MSEQHESTATSEQATMKNYTPQLTRRCSAARIGRRTPEPPNSNNGSGWWPTCLGRPCFLMSTGATTMRSNNNNRSNSNEHYFHPSRKWALHPRRVGRLRLLHPGYFMDVTKFRTLRQAGFEQAFLDFVGRLSLGPFFVGPASGSRNHEQPNGICGSRPASTGHFLATRGGGGDASAVTSNPP
jgi:hypothetical protein